MNPNTNQAENLGEKELQVRVLKVATSTNVGKLASSIFAAWQDKPDQVIAIRGVGAGAINQALKSVIVANRQFIRLGCVAYMMPAFVKIDGTVPGDNTSSTAMDITLKITRV